MPSPSGGLQPNDTPPMELGEARRFSFPLAAEVGVNTISSVEVAGSNLTLGTPTISGTTVAVRCSPDSTGTHYLTLLASLSSDEIVKKVLRVHCVDSTCQSNGRDY